ncbi:hypothetical protein C9994_11045 [Marivirga lumbricoides]|uniref:eCIS core domain-containing protein n=1 Tax=Marivirga lumbricoides TaxID=1046115 RepID=A0A2T4DP91_9BACT|nr:hypothetical protein C9994_11045 [Marivirga lumbricoides]
MNRFEQSQQSSSTKGGLDKAVQAKMEKAFQSDFSDVNITQNSSEATNMGALAFTQGNDVHFAPGQYNPATSEGQELIGHELTHVIQQKQGRVKATSQAKGAPVNDDPALEKEADVMGKKAASGEHVIVQKKSKSEVVQKADDDSKILSDLHGRAQGDSSKKYNYDPISDKSKAIESSDNYFQKAYGEVNFAENLIQSINIDLIKIYDQIKNGQISAIEAIQKSMNEQHEKEQMIRACLIAFVSIIGAWAPIAAAGVASTEANIMSRLQKQVGDGLKIKSIKIPAYAQKIKDFGQSKMLSPWMTTMRAVNGSIKTKPSSAKETIRMNIGTMADKTSFAVHALVLEMGMMLKNDPEQKLDHGIIAALKGSLYKEIMSTIFPEYQSEVVNQSFSEIQNLAKTQMLKSIVLNSGKITKSQFSESWDSIEGNNHKDGASTVEHALNAMGGESEFIKELKHPNEFAFASLNSSLSHMGLSINTTDENMIKASETDFLNENRGFKININDPSSFKDFLDDKQIVTNNHYSAISGPIKEMKESHPGETGGLYSSYTGYNFTYENVDVQNMEVWVHPSEYVSMMNGKVKDITSFTLKFNSSGEASVYKYKVTRAGRNSNKHGKHAVNGLNLIKVRF